MAARAQEPLIDSQSTPTLAASPLSAAGLRVALFSGNYNYVRDGANRALNRLVAHLLHRGAAVRVYSPTTRKPAFAPVGDLVSVPSIGIPGRSEYRLAVGLPATIREDIRTFAPTHFHLSCPDFLGNRAQALARTLGVPVVASMHTRFETYPAFYHLDFLTPAIKRILRNFYGRSDLTLAPNLPMANSLREFGLTDAQLRVWGRGVDHAQFTPSRRSLQWRRAKGYRDDEAVVLFFGRIVREKGLDTFAAAMQLLAKRGERIHPMIVGEGPARAWIAEQLPEARFTGHLDGEALGVAVASCDILVNPSTTEAFGNVNLEAMAAGLAVVSADVGSAQALIEDGRNGILVAAEEPEAYAAAIRSLIGSPEHRRGLGSAAVATSAAFKWDDILDSVVDSYQSLPAGRTDPA